MLKWVAIVAGFGVVCALAVGIRLHRVHDESGEWKMRPSAEPLMLRYQGHVYHRTGIAEFKELGFKKQGEDMGGGQILAPLVDHAPATIQVHNLRRFYVYRLAS